MIYPEQKREYVDGTPSSCVCHIEHASTVGNVYPAHFHNYIEILYGMTGTYDVLLNGSHYTFSNGDMVLINSREVHQINSMSENGGDYFVLRFDPEILYSNMFRNNLEFKYVLPFLLENSNHQKVIAASDIKDTFIPNLFHEVQREFEQKEYGYEFAVKNHIGRIFLWILRHFHNAGTGFSIPSTKEDRMNRLQPAFDYVLENYNEEIKTEYIAELCNMSFCYFSRIFNQQMEMSFCEYVNRIRIMEAEKLLISTTMNITEIATSVGLNTTSYFIKLFKKYKNVTPKQFKIEAVNS